ncbi:MAG: class I SAM-dependent methyltransferase [Alphaproteobacteria bacterium]|nr:class I SAM-dependent methyltransferase [Alphaproteobacteria bacterium]
MATNADQIAYWNGQTGRKWAEDADKMDTMMRSLTEAVLSAAVPSNGESVLDIGCGSGGTTLALADAVGRTGSVTGIDISHPMLEVARERARGRDNVHFLEVDASAHALPAASADLIFSKFGVMFFADPEQAFRNIRRAARPGARLAFICWRTLHENPFATVPMGMALKHLPPQPPPDPTAPGPFAFADPVRVGHILTEAGFQTPAFAAFDTTMVIGRTAPGAAREAVQMGMASRLLMNAPDELKEKVIAELTAEYEKHMTHDGVTFPAHCWIVTASV